VTDFGTPAIWQQDKSPWPRWPSAKTCRRPARERDSDRNRLATIPKEISAKAFERARVQMNQKAMQPKRENQPTFFDLAVQQRGSANRVLERPDH
jgi:hypothetical protein